MAMASLPDHMVEEIVAWLPVQSILRFRSVSKSWTSLTRHPYFINQHHTHSPLRRDSTHLLISFGGGDSYQYHNQTILTATHDGAAPSPLHLPPNILEHGPFNLSCCQGLISLHPREPKSETFVYNPSTRETQSIPFNADAYTDYEYVRSYIGFEPVSKQYKIMILGTWEKHTGGQHCEILTLGTQDWRQVATNGAPPRDGGDSTYLNGALHWLGNDCQRIEAFDLESEKFRTIPGPKPIQESQLIELCIVRGRLTVVGSGTYRPEVSFELWTLKDYYSGLWVKESMVFSVPRDLSSADIGGRYLHIVGGIGIDTDEVLVSLLRYKPEAFCYDMKAKKGRKIDISGEHNIDNIMLYTETLQEIHLKCFDGNQ